MTTVTVRRTEIQTEADRKTDRQADYRGQSDGPTYRLGQIDRRQTTDSQSQTDYRQSEVNGQTHRLRRTDRHTKRGR